MEQSLEKYGYLLKIFYGKTVRTHSCHSQMMNEFRKMIQQNLHGGKTCSTSKKKVNPHALNERSQRLSIKSLLTTSKSQQTLLTNSNVSNCEYIFCSRNVNKTFIFGYLYQLIKIQSCDHLCLFEKRVYLLMETTQKQFNPEEQESWNKDLMGFKKVIQLLQHKNKVRWILILKRIINDLGKSFTEIFFKSILNVLSAAEFLHYFPISQKNMPLIAQKLNICLLYSHIDQKNQAQSFKYGENNQFSLKIQFIIQSKEYTFTENIRKATQQHEVKQKGEKKSCLKNKVAQIGSMRNFEIKKSVSDLQKNVSNQCNIEEESRPQKHKASREQYELKRKQSKNNYKKDGERCKTHKVVQSVLSLYSKNTSMLSKLPIFNQNCEQ